MTPRGPLPAPVPRRGEVVPASEFVTPPTVAAWLAIPVPAVYEGAERGLIPAIRHGSRWRFHGPTIRRWMETSAPRTGPAQGADPEGGGGAG